MTFGDFARNYLNPFYLIFRVGWLFAGFLCIFVFGPFTTDGSALGKFAFLIGGVLLIWNGLRPWGKGMSINDINRKLDDLNRR